MQSLLQEPSTPAEPSQAPAHAGLPRYADPRQRIGQRQRVDPLSAERYRIQFTADSSLKQKLELARDLLRHSHPSGDFALIVSRALDLLLQELMQRRFGARRKDTPRRAAHTASHAAPTATSATRTEDARQQFLTLSATATSATAATATATPATATPPIATPRPSRPPLGVSAPARPVAAPSATTPSAATPSPTAIPPATATPAAASTSRVARAARRVVLERDGLGCGWVDVAGKRCSSAAWLELDHHHPSGKGGGSGPANLRLLCRAHNRFAAELAYGREHVERAIQARQRSAKRRGESGQPPPCSPTPSSSPAPA